MSTEEPQATAVTGATSGLPIDGEHFRHVLSHFPTGVVVVTAVAGDGGLAGMAVGSFTSVSLSPPLVAYLPDMNSTSFPRIRTATSFCVNVLAADQQSVCRAFATRGGDKFEGIPWSANRYGAPRITGAAAWIDCNLESVTEAGDHYIVLGRVLALATPGDTSPLVFHRNRYGSFSPLNSS